MWNGFGGLDTDGGEVDVAVVAFPSLKKGYVKYIFDMKNI